MAKNKDSKTVNRTGVLSMDDMTVTYKEKDTYIVFDLKSLLQDFDGGHISINVASDFEPSHQVED